MTVMPSVPPFWVVVARLRAAGCVFAEDEARLLLSATRTPAELDTMIERRVAGLPLEHVLGWAEFCGLRIVVDAGVFVPRRRTELLVHQAAELVRQRAGAVDAAGRPSGPVVVDLCCGSGAVGTALASILGQIELYAAEIDPTAVRCARRNVIPAGGQVVEGDLYEALPATLRGRIDVLVANAPYVPTEAIGLMAPEARLYEARVALDGGTDGLDVQRRIADAAPLWLAPGGHLLVETSERQAAATVEIFAQSGLVARVTSSDELDGTVVVGTLG
jgi:release factor glutamine methyltransferase